MHFNIGLCAQATFRHVRGSYGNRPRDLMLTNSLFWIGTPLGWAWEDISSRSSEIKYDELIKPLHNMYMLDMHPMMSSF